MAEPTHEQLLEALLDSWNRNNTIMVSLLRALKGQGMDTHYDHPILFLQHMLWHEGYHHGQVKLALKLACRPISDDVAAPISWAYGWTRQLVRHPCVSHGGHRNHARRNRSAGNRIVEAKTW